MYSSPHVCIVYRKQSIRLENKQMSVSRYMVDEEVEQWQYFFKLGPIET